MSKGTAEALFRATPDSKPVQEELEVTTSRATEELDATASRTGAELEVKASRTTEELDATASRTGAELEVKASMTTEELEDTTSSALLAWTLLLFLARISFRELLGRRAASDDRVRRIGSSLISC